MGHLYLNEESSWLRITLNRPLKKNALNPVLIQELSNTFSNVQKNKKIIGVILRGEGSCFCSGADLNWIHTASSQELEQLFNLFQIIESCSSPVIAYVHGSIFGGGIGLMSVCDFVSAQNQTQFCFSELKLGLMPALIAPFIIRNKPYLKSHLLTALPFGVDEALKAQLIHISGSEQECQMWEKKMMDNLSSLNLNAFRETKKFLKNLQNLQQENIKDHSIKCFNERKNDPLMHKSILEFLNKKSSL